MDKKSLLLLVLGGVLAWLGSGCQTPRPSAADTGPAQTIVGGDITISASREVFNTFLRWEKENRAVLAGTPEVRRYAELVRNNSDTWLNEVVSLRNMYAVSRTPENLRRLELSLAKLDSSTSEAESLMAENTWKVLPYLKEP